MELGKIIKNAWLCICEAVRKVFSADSLAQKGKEERQTVARESSGNNDYVAQGDSEPAPTAPDTPKAETTSGNTSDTESGGTKEKSETHGLGEEISSSANSNTHDDSSVKSDAPQTTAAAQDNPEPAPITPGAPEVETASDSTSDTESGEAKEKSETEKIHPPPDSDTHDEPTIGPAAPRKIGGRRGGKPTKSTAKKRKAKQQPYCDLICVEEDNGQWSIAVSVPKDHHVLSVRQNGKDLLPINGNHRHYVLEDICSDVEVEFEGGQKKTITLSGGKHFQVFKTRQNWEGIGRRVKTVSSGDYVVFADETCGNRIGDAPIYPEQCRYPGFMTHFFQITDETNADRFENCSFYSPKRRFSLTGKYICNDAGGGSIFIGDAPCLNDIEEWKGVSWVVVGKEDTEDVLDEFKASGKDIDDILNNYQNGWFFIRIYDGEASLLHSMDFRWVKNLQDIHVDGNSNWQDSPIVPSESSGHSETKVDFKGDVLVSSVDSPHTRKTALNAFVVSPHPDSDRTKWIFKNNEEETESTMILPRVWFKFENADWQDKPVKMKREEFRRARNKNVHIRVPLSVKKARIGFSNLDQVFPARLCEDRKTKNIGFQLDDFVDCLEVENPLHERIALRAQLDTNDVVIPIIYIPADAPPNENIPPGDDVTISWPIAYVMKGANAFRLGKGFSHGELQAANLSNDTTIDWQIKRDKRRRTAHHRNIEALITYRKKYDA